VATASETWPAWASVPGDENDHVALYVRLSRIFRQKILSREWPRGGQLPTVVQLCKEYGAAPITVRQALKLLADDGWIIATRGRGTFVNGRAQPSDEDPELRAAISNPLTIGPANLIKMIKRVRPVALPSELSADVVQESYVLINKLHVYRGVPFAFMNIYATTRAYDRFPPGADEKFKISRLFREHSAIPIKRDRQLFTIAYADREASGLLQYSLGGVLVCMRTWWFDAEDRVVYAGIFYFRSDMFVLERGATYPPEAMHPAMLLPNVREEMTGPEAPKQAAKPKPSSK